MSKIYLINIYIILSISLAAQAQIITCNPTNPTTDDSVTVVFDASQGSKGLMGYTGDVYAHTGVLTSASTNSGDWKHAPVWGDNSEKYKMTRVGTDLYELKINPSIIDYYGILPNEIVTNLAFVFRSSDNTLTGRTATGGDIFYDVIDTDLHISIIKPAMVPFMPLIGEKIIIQAASNNADSLKLFLQDSLILKVPGKNILDSITANILGKFWIKILAKKGTETVIDSFYYFVRDSLTRVKLPAGINDGINYINDSTVILCLVAPKKSSSFVIGDFNNWNLDNSYQMKQTFDTSRFWIQLNNLKEGEEYAYQYIVDGSITIADPFTQKILDPSNDQFIDSVTYPDLKAYPIGKTTGNVSVLQTAQTPYNWKYNLSTPPAKQNLVIYELMVRDFMQSHSYKGVIDSLGYLKSLGINAIELMPVMEFEGNISWGYNPIFYFAPDKYYGTSNDLKKLIDTCHSEGIAVILDIVLNHSFGQSPMVQLYWDSQNNRPAADNPWFNPIPKHDYNVGYDFNHESPYTKKFVSQVLKFWLTQYKADGFRFDLSKGFTQKNTLGNDAAWANYDTGRVAILKAIADTVWSVNNKAYVILEHFADNDEEQVLDTYGMMLWGNLNYNYTQASMGYSTDEDISWGSYKARSFANPGLITYMESHDEERMMYKNLTYGNIGNPNYYIKDNLVLSLVRAELATAFLFTIPGPKMMWQFGELGYDYSINYNNDRTGLKPIRWDYYSNPNRYRLYSVYKELIKLKENDPAFQSSDFTLNVGDSLKIIAINNPSMDVRIIGNFSVNKQKIDASFSKTGMWYDYFSGDSLTVTDVHQLINLDISEYRIYTSVKLAKPNIIAAPEARNVTIAGNIQSGSTLSASYDYFDLNGDAEGTSEFKWYRCSSAIGSDKTEITGATSKQYTLTDDDHGMYVFFEVTPVAQTGYLTRGIPQYSSVDFAVGIGKVNLNKMSVYPNPFIDRLTLMFDDAGIKNVSVEISNTVGQLIMKTFVSSNNSILLNNLSDGIYILTAHSGSNIWRKNIMKIE